MLDDFEIDYPEDEEYGEDEEGGGGPNRKVLLIAGILGVGIIAVIACIVLALKYLPLGRVDTSAQTQTAAVVNATDAAHQTETFIAGMSVASNTPLPSQIPTNTPTPTATKEPEAVGPTATSEGGPTADPRTATVQALLTQAAMAQTQAAEAILTVTATPTSTALPDTGFADDVGIPALLGMTLLLIMVIFVARRLRETTV